ncbi:hypothetical protein ACFU98_30995 [Streptomyces sp. NPDC057575]|uniref:hypothetical protein n=1 Tax=unclassified Streptomyces TaxID=2593676 RepID=UPI0036CAC950
MPVHAMRRDVEQSARDGAPLRVEDHVQAHPDEPGQLFMIPAGTPHASGVGNVVLGVSATPYLYSLRLYDWLRHSGSGVPRPLSHAHAFANLDIERRGDDVLMESYFRHSEVSASLDGMSMHLKRVDEY